MGNSPSAPAPSGVSRRPMLFGGAGDGPVRAATMQHQQQGAVRTPTVNITSQTCVSQYNAETGDRRARVKPKLDTLACCCFAEDAAGGTLALFGGSHGAVLMHDALTLELRRSVPKAGKLAAVTALVPTGPKTVLVGYADGSAVEVVVGTGARVAAFPFGTAGAGVGRAQAAALASTAGAAGQGRAAGPALHASPVLSLAHIPARATVPSGGVQAGGGVAPSSSSAMVAVSHADGVLRLYDGGGAALLVEQRLVLAAGTHLCLAYAPALHCLVGAEVASPSSITHTGVALPPPSAGAGGGGGASVCGKAGQRVWLWDLTAPASSTEGGAVRDSSSSSLDLDLGPELESIGAGGAVATCLLVKQVAAAVQSEGVGDTDALVFLGYGDGTVLVRHLRAAGTHAEGSAQAQAVAGEEGAAEVGVSSAPAPAPTHPSAPTPSPLLSLSLSLLRVIKPSSGGQAPGPITCLSYNAGKDVLLVGDAIGYARVVPRAT